MVASLLSVVLLVQSAQQPPAPVPRRAWQDFCCYEKGRVERDGLVTVVYELSHTPTTPPNVQGLEEYQKMLQPYLSPKGRVDVSNRMSALTVTDTKEAMALVERMLHLLHTPDQPIMIEAKVVELRWDNDLQIGFQGDLNPSNAAWIQSPGSEAFLREFRIALDLAGDRLVLTPPGLVVVPGTNAR